MNYPNMKTFGVKGTLAVVIAAAVVTVSYLWVNLVYFNTDGWKAWLIVVIAIAWFLSVAYGAYLGFREGIIQRYIDAYEGDGLDR